MLNREKYAKEILDIACNGDKIAVKNSIEKLKELRGGENGSME